MLCNWRCLVAAPHSVAPSSHTRNLEPAHHLGMRTVWLASDIDWAARGADEDYVHFVADDLKAFLSALAKAA